jgi:hypothetical protein
MILGKTSRLFPAMIAFISLSAGAGQGIHIDASSDAAANRSLQRMLSSMDTNQKTQLSDAIVQLNRSVDDASGSAANAAQQRPSAARIKDKIGGLTASEIIELAHRTAPATASPPAK